MQFTTLFPILSLFLGIILVVLIMLQRPVTDAGSAFGGDSSAHFKKRGAEKKLYTATLFVAVLFVAVQLATLVA
jgi:protein translocase SecG subunit